MKKFFMTFVAENETQLNEKIYEFAEKNGYEEIERSAPAVACFEGFFKTAVTSTFANSDDVRNEDIPTGVARFISTFGK